MLATFSPVMNQCRMSYPNKIRELLGENDSDYYGCQFVTKLVIMLEDRSYLIFFKYWFNTHGFFLVIFTKSDTNIVHVSLI